MCSYQVVPQMRRKYLPLSVKLIILQVKMCILRRSLNLELFMCGT